MINSKPELEKKSQEQVPKTVWMKNTWTQLNFNALRSQIHENRIQIVEKFMNGKNQRYKQIEQSRQQINERILKIQQNQSLKPSKNFHKQNPRTGTDPKIQNPKP